MLYCWHSCWKLQYKDFWVFRCPIENSTENSKIIGWVQWWLWRNLTLVVLILKELLNLLVRSRLWLATIPASQRYRSVWVSYQSGSAWRHLLFLIQDEKRPIFYHRPWRIRRKTMLQNFWTNLSITSNWTCFGFSQIKKISVRIRRWSHRATIGLLWPYVWQQDSVLRHTSRRTKKICDHMIPSIWTLNSRDCNPLDYYVWGPVEWETNKTRCNTKNELKARIIAAFTNLYKKTVGNGCRRFWSHLKVNDFCE